MMSFTPQMHLLHMAKNQTDVVYTPEWAARDMVAWAKPTGTILDPCMGDGAFYNLLPEGSLWCEIDKGRDFFAWDTKVDWIIGNPPYSVFSQWLQHSFSIANDIAYLIPANKPFNSTHLLRLIYKFGGIKAMRVYGSGSMFKAGIGFAIAAVHFKRDWVGDMTMSFVGDVPMM